MRYRFALPAFAVLAALATTGCVTNKKFQTAVGEVSGRIDATQTTVEQHGKRLDQIEAKNEKLSTDISRVDQAAGAAQQTGETALAKAADAERLAKGKVIWQVTLTNHDLRFDTGKAELTDSGHAVLDELVSRVKSMDHMVFVEIQGHTDSSGNETYNKFLGEKRADVVRDYLHEQGLPLNLMQTISYGETRPIADNKSRDGRATNRRVEVLVLE